jgi:hypothetical protein
MQRLGTVTQFTLSNTSQASAKFGAQTRGVRIAVGSTGSTPSGAYILFGDSTGLSVTSTNGSLMPAPWVDEFIVTPGQTFYTISSSTSVGGILTLTEFS